MKTQKVSVDVWAMVQSMLGYLMLAIVGGIFLRLVVATMTLPGRLRKQKDDVQRAMRELETRYPEAFKSAMDECTEEEAKKLKKDPGILDDDAEKSCDVKIKQIEESDESMEADTLGEEKKSK